MGLNYFFKFYLIPLYSRARKKNGQGIWNPKLSMNKTKTAYSNILRIYSCKTFCYINTFDQTMSNHWGLMNFSECWEKQAVHEYDRQYVNEGTNGEAILEEIQRAILNCSEYLSKKRKTILSGKWNSLNTNVALGKSQLK